VNTSTRLTESDVHAAADALRASGEKPTTLLLLKSLGRGSLTTIGKYLSTWQIAGNDDASPAVEAPLLDLPPELQQMMRRIWSDACVSAHKQLDVERTAFRDAEHALTLQLAEAGVFSEVQSQTIDCLETEIDQLRGENERLGQQLEQAVNRAIEQGRAQQEAIAVLTERCAGFEARLEDRKQFEQQLQSRVDVLESEVQSKNKEIQDLRVFNTGLQARLESAAREMEYLKPKKSVKTGGVKNVES
jgi:hypothetical protein